MTLMIAGFTIAGYRWMDPEGENVGDLKFTCECGKQVERETADIYDAITCECGRKWKLSVIVCVRRQHE